MTQEELNYIKDAFSQIIDDIAGNPDWNEAARAVASDLGTLERELEEKVASLPSNLDEAAEEIVKDWNAYGDGEYKKLVVAGVEWMAGQGYSEVADVWSFGKNGIPAIFVDDAMYLPGIEFKPGDKVIVQIRKEQ